MVHDVKPYYNVCNSWVNYIHIEIKYTLNYFHWPALITLRMLYRLLKMIPRGIYSHAEHSYFNMKTKMCQYGKLILM